jgi:hypothetical protein
VTAFRKACAPACLQGSEIILHVLDYVGEVLTALGIKMLYLKHSGHRRPPSPNLAASADSNF